MKNKVLILLTAILLFNCKETDSEWKDLIVNDSLEGWHFFQDNGLKKGWIVEDGVLIFNGVSDMETDAGDASLISDKKYENFEIKFDWKIEPGGNSGFIWGVSEDKKYKYPYQTGQEIQILDHAIYDDPKNAQGGETEIRNAREDLEARKHFVGAYYDLSAPTVLNAAKPANEWNSYHIKIDYSANLGEVTLNGILINSFPLKGAEWDKLYNNSKFSRSEDYPYLGDERWKGFAKYQKGHISFQDHPGRVSFKNIKVREL